MQRWLCVYFCRCVCKGSAPRNHGWRFPYAGTGNRWLRGGPMRSKLVVRVLGTIARGGRVDSRQHFLHECLLKRSRSYFRQATIKSRDMYLSGGEDFERQLGHLVVDAPQSLDVGPFGARRHQRRWRLVRPRLAHQRHRDGPSHCRRGPVLNEHLVARGGGR